MQVCKRKLERVQSGLDLFSVLLQLNGLDPEHRKLQRELLARCGAKTCFGSLTTSRQKQPAGSRGRSQT